MLASVWIWTRVTGGEYLFAPAMMADPGRTRGQQSRGRDRLNYIDLRWPHLATGTRGNHSELRQRLNDYADQLAADIDSSLASVIGKQPPQKLTKEIPATQTP
jgi:hypothetical protein